MAGNYTLTIVKPDAFGAAKKQRVRQARLLVRLIGKAVDAQDQPRAFPLGEANEVLARLRSGQILGAAVLTP